MIDAYEIGIQLLLEDDVSAGLAVINRELAEVDRAIAATSANLVRLAQDADRTTKAVAVAGAKAAPAVAQTSVAPDPSSDGAREARPAQVAEVAPGSDADSRTAAAEPTPAEPTPVPAGAPAVDVPRPKATVQPDAAVPSAAPSAPVSSGPETATGGARRSEGSPAVPPPPERTAAVAPQAAVQTRRVARQDQAAALPAVQRSAPPAAPHVAITAAVGRSNVDGRPVAPPAVIHSPGASVGGVSRERAIVPRSGVAPTAAASDPMRMQARAAEAPLEGRQRGESLGGTVTLDGRLVGQWLSDHMGREASRPPGGPSFFDPRQTPAWNVSGAI